MLGAIAVGGLRTFGPGPTPYHPVPTWRLHGLFCFFNKKFPEKLRPTARDGFSRQKPCKKQPPKPRENRGNIPARSPRDLRTTSAGLRHEFCGTSARRNHGGTPYPAPVRQQRALARPRRDSGATSARPRLGARAPHRATPARPRRDFCGTSARRNPRKHCVPALVRQQPALVRQQRALARPPRDPRATSARLLRDLCGTSARRNIHSGPRPATATPRTATASLQMALCPAQPSAWCLRPLASAQQ